MPPSVILDGVPVPFSYDSLSDARSEKKKLKSSGGTELELRLVAHSHPIDPNTHPHYLESAAQELSFRYYQVDVDNRLAFAFTVRSQPEDSLPIRSLRLTSDQLTSVDVDFGYRSLAVDAIRTDSDSKALESDGVGTDDVMKFDPEDANLDFVDEVESLRLLETEAETLHTLVATKKQVIAAHLRHHRDHVSLRQLLAECDGLMCAAHVVAQRICDKFGSLAEQKPGYAEASGHFVQNLMVSHGDSEKPQQASRNHTKSVTFAEGPLTTEKGSRGTAQPMKVPLVMTQNGTAHKYHFKDVVDSPNFLVRAMQVIAAVLGIAALCTYIRHKCMSMRKRVERAADREERRNARAYRRAARRADMRRRWDNFVSAINCFRSATEPRTEDYEEKRALILQDAFLEQLDDLDQAEKGQIMEAEIRELRYAHEIVASLVRVDENRYNVVTLPANDPPPSRVALPYTPDSRSRASTNTLPSYNSEILPDYSSQAQTMAGSSTCSSVANGTNYTPVTSDDEEEGGPAPSTSSRGRTRYTPTSSVLDISPRVSAETLRTRQSKDAQGL